jgi:NHL repeat
MKITRYLAIGATVAGSLLAASIATGVWQPQAKAQSSSTPVFAVDASWPKALPAPVGTDGLAHAWVQGEVAADCIDMSDNVYTFNRGWEVGATVNGVLQGNESGAINGNDATSGGAIPSPPVVAFDSNGNVIQGWGNPSLIPTTEVDYGYAAYMPQGAHGCYIDYQGYMWVGGNGDGLVQKYNPATANQEGASATYVFQIGTKGMCDTTTPPAAGVNPFTSCSETTDANSSHTLLNEPADMAVDPLPDPVTHTRGSVYIADGYGNHRIVVYTTADGGQTYTYNRQWGQTCMINGVPSDSQSCPAGTFGATGGGHPHCVVLGNDGNVYVCDRPNSRIQVFSRSCGAASVPTSDILNTQQPLCVPLQIINIGANAGQPSPTNTTVVGNNAFASAAPAAAAAILGSTETRADWMDFWPNIDYLATESPKTPKVIIDVDLDNDNTWLFDKATYTVFGALGICGIIPCPGHNAGNFAYGHSVAVDSKGNAYVAETITGRRIQKFVPVSGQ